MQYYYYTAENKNEEPTKEVISMRLFPTKQTNTNTGNMHIFERLTIVSSVSRKMHLDVQFADEVRRVRVRDPDVERRLAIIRD